MSAKPAASGGDGPPSSLPSEAKECLTGRSFIYLTGVSNIKRVVGVSVVCLLAASSIALAASGPNKTIVVGQSIAGVKLGVGEAQVQAALGKPEFVQKGGGITWYYFPNHATSGNALFSVYFRNGHITSGG